MIIEDEGNENDIKNRISQAEKHIISKENFAFKKYWIRSNEEVFEASHFVDVKSFSP